MMAIHRTGTLSTALAELRKEIARRVADFSTVLGWLLIPLLVGGLLTVVIGGGGGEGPQPKAQLLVADLDDTFLSQAFVGALGGGQLADLLEVESVDAESGRAHLDAGDASALLILPAGFADALLRETPQTLELVTNPAQSILPRIPETVLEMLRDATFAAHRVFGPELETLADVFATDGDASTLAANAATAAFAVQMKEAVERVGPFVDPPLLAVETVETVPEPERGVSFVLLLFPGIVVMGLFFAAQGLAEDWWAEREAGTLRRLLATATPLHALALGKTLAAAATCASVAGLLLLLGFAWHGLPWSRLPAAWLCATLGGVLLYLILTSLQFLMASRRAGQLLGQLLIFPLLMVGGSFFPSEVLPGFVRGIGAFTPNGWLTERLKEVVLGAGPTQGLWGLGSVALITAFALLPVIALLHRRFAPAARGDA